MEYTRSPVILSYNSKDKKFNLNESNFYYETPDGNAYLRYEPTSQSFKVGIKKKRGNKPEIELRKHEFNTYTFEKI